MSRVRLRLALVTVLLAVLVGALTLPFRFSFSRYVLTSVQVLSRAKEFYVIATTYKSRWRPNLREFILSNLAGAALPYPGSEDMRLIVIHSPDGTRVQSGARAIPVRIGSPFVLHNQLYFTWGVNDPKDYPQLLAITGTAIEPVAHDEAATIVSSFSNSRQTTEAEGWLIQNSFDPSGTRTLSIEPSAGEVQITRSRSGYRLTLCSRDGTVLFKLQQ